MDQIKLILCNEYNQYNQHTIIQPAHDNTTYTINAITNSALTSSAIEYSHYNKLNINPNDTNTTTSTSTNNTTNTGNINATTNTTNASYIQMDLSVLCEVSHSFAFSEEIIQP